MRARWLACVAVLTCCVSGCGYSSLTRQDEEVKAAWSEVLNQYQRRADLIPNLVKAVQGYANQEQQVLIGVTAERAKAASSVQLTPELLNNPDAFARFQAVQAQLGASLKRPDRGGRGLPGPEVEREFPRPAGAARGHGKSHHGGAAEVHRGRAGVQHDRPGAAQSAHGQVV